MLIDIVRRCRQFATHCATVWFLPMWTSICFLRIAGHYRTNPWPAVPDWSWCRNADAGLMLRTNGKTNDAGLTFSPVFRHFGNSRGDIFRVQTRRVLQTIVFRYREIGGRLGTKYLKKSLVPVVRGTTLFLQCFVHNLYPRPRFLCSGTLWFAKHNVFVL
jgi:hypothetical protein